MKLSLIPISLCHGICPHCAHPTEFKMFESGAGGDFSTYMGSRTGALYRVDLMKLHYKSTTIHDLLTPAMDRDKSLIKIPDEIRCKICGMEYSADKIFIGGEEIVSAYEL